MKEEFDWKEAEYPCLGINDGEIVCFSNYGIGHKITNVYDNSSCWDMSQFKPYIPPKEKTKLWYWEFNKQDMYELYYTRISEEDAEKQFGKFKYFNKLEALGFIEED